MSAVEQSCTNVTSAATACHFDLRGKVHLPEDGTRGEGRMRRWASCGIVTVLWVSAFALPAMAFVPHTGQTVIVSEPLKDDLYLAGGTVTATASIDGDVVAAGGTVDLTGDVSGSVLAVGGTVTAGGTIGRTLRAAGGVVTVDSRIKSDAVLAGGTVRVDSAARVGRDLVVGGGSVNISGTVARNAVIGGGDVVIGGAIDGDAEIQASRIVLLRTARIRGALRYSADQPIEVQAGASIAGGTTQMPAPSRPRQAVGAPFSTYLWLWRGVAELIALLAIGFVTFAVAPRGAFPVVREVGERFGRSLLTGFVLLVTVPTAAVLLVFTVVGIPLSAIGMLLYVATLYPGSVFVAARLGDRVLRWMRRRGGEAPSIYWSVAVGAVVLAVLFAVPFAGWVIRLVAVLAGFGALWATVWRAVAARSSTPGTPSPAATV